MAENLRVRTVSGDSIKTSSEFSIDEAFIKKTGPYLEGNMKLLDTIETPADVMSCRFSPDGSHLAVGLCDGSIKIYSSSTGSMLYSLMDEETMCHRLPVTQIRFRPHAPEEKPEYVHIILASYASGLVKFWHYTTGKCLHTINEVRQTLALAVKPDGRHFVTAGANTQIYLYDMETKQKIQTCEPSDSRDVMNGHRFRVFAAQYNVTHPKLFITGGWDDTVQYWDERQVHALKRFVGPHICGDALDIDPIHNHILTGSWRKNAVLQIWDFPKGEKIKDVPQDTLNTSQLYCAQWLGKDSIICGGNGENMARIIDRGTLNTTGQLVDLPQGVYCIDNDRQGNHAKIAIGCSHFIFLVRNEKRNA
ncbi:POC1 centriolar protein homolog A-like [Gigantopelta aegis]|uniref:POC1 centriolar protein homolog A-like n=1 Tax=Gigantopelta aegis TaxID=1735272 RepID=UPI001B88A9D8|nr:POC1 centriolar protein homolog A-like [Gigantopelta aegis]